MYYCGQELNRPRWEVSNLLHIVQLKDGCYKIEVDFARGDLHVHWEKTMKPTESDADPLDGGDEFRLEFRDE